MSEVDFLNDAIAERFGFVRRARGPFLYTQKGVRLTDLYRDAGRAVLGWAEQAPLPCLRMFFRADLPEVFHMFFGKAFESCRNFT